MLFSLWVKLKWNNLELELLKFKELKILSDEYAKNYIRKNIYFLQKQKLIKFE